MQTASPGGGNVSQPSPVSQRFRRTPPSAAEQERRVAWGKMAGAKVAAAYRELREAEAA